MSLASVTAATTVSMPAWTRAPAFVKALKTLLPSQFREDATIHLKAAPGLMTFMDVALYQSVEGQLTATICSSHSLLCAWIELKQQAQLVLHLITKGNDVEGNSSYGHWLDGDVNESESAEGEESSSNHRNGSVNNASRHSNASHSRQNKTRTQYMDNLEDLSHPYRILIESFARQCWEAASDAIERLTTDRLAATANLSDPYDSIGGDHDTVQGNISVEHHNSGVGWQGIANGIMQGKAETGRRRYKCDRQRDRDCWESPRLFCPDYVWADDTFVLCQRLLRLLGKHTFMMEDAERTLTSSSNGQSGSNNFHSPIVGLRMATTPECDRQASLLLRLVQDDLPLRLYQFRVAMEAESVVTKRLYLVKCEYRAPFRGFLESHQSVLRAPPMRLVQMYLKQGTTSRDSAKAALQELVETPALVESLALEHECDELELSMGRALFPFSELSRLLDQKRAKLQYVPGIIDNNTQMRRLQETIRRLKSILCRKGGPDTSSGIRPMLLDLQGVARDDEILPNDATGRNSDGAANMENRLKQFVHQLYILGRLCRTRRAFATDRRSDIDLPSSIVKGCTDQFDAELFTCHCLDWHSMVQRQHELGFQRGSNLDNTGGSVASNASTSDVFSDLMERIRLAELEMSIAGAPEQSLQLVRQRLETIATDREKRFQILHEMIAEVCMREFGLSIRLAAPDPQATLRLPSTSETGFLGQPLQMAGEPLPIG